MARPLPPLTQSFTIIAQDPSVRYKGRILTSEVEVPAEKLNHGPWGYRVHVVDYDASTDTFYRPVAYKTGRRQTIRDPFKESSNRDRLTDPRFHAQNAYAIVMRILARFEFALGRRVGWSFKRHQLKIAPHAFQDANAFYSRQDEGLFFGYFPGRTGTVFSCLSHDVVAHETTHALLDGLRELYMVPSSPDQAAFHEGFADIVALLSVFSLKEIVKAGLALGGKGERRTVIRAPKRSGQGTLISRERLTIQSLRRSVLLSLAEQMGKEMSVPQGQALRQSAKLTPSRRYIENADFREPHRRGEVLVAAVLNAFLRVWIARLRPLGEITPGYLSLERVVEEGATAADHLLTICIRAIDYCPPVHITFGDFLSAVLTADEEACPDDSRFGYRKCLLRSFESYGIRPASPQITWMRATRLLEHERVHFDPLKQDPDELFHFIWENRKALRLCDGVFTGVVSLRPSVRRGPDGFVLQETVAEYVQIASLKASDLRRRLKIRPPEDMPLDTPVTLYGGGTLVLDEWGNVKYHIRNRLDHATLQEQRLKYLWESGFFAGQAAGLRRFAQLHRMRAVGKRVRATEGWI